MLWEKTTLQTQAPYLHISQFLRTGQHPCLRYVPLHESLKEENWLVGRFLKNHRVALQIQHIRRLYRSDMLELISKNLLYQYVKNVTRYFVLSCATRWQNCSNPISPSQTLLNNEEDAIGDKVVNTDNAMKPENGDRENSPGQMEIYWDSVNEAKRSSFLRF